MAIIAAEAVAIRIDNLAVEEVRRAVNVWIRGGDAELLLVRKTKECTLSWSRCPGGEHTHIISEAVSRYSDPICH